MMMYFQDCNLSLDNILQCKLKLEKKKLSESETMKIIVVV